MDAKGRKTRRGGVYALGEDFEDQVPCLPKVIRGVGWKEVPIWEEDSREYCWVVYLEYIRGVWREISGRRLVYGKYGWSDDLWVRGDATRVDEIVADWFSGGAEQLKRL